MSPLYLFPHIPKTGGAALIQNVERFLSPSQFLRLNFTYQQFYKHPRTQEPCFYQSADDFKNLIHSLSRAEKSNIKFITGHDLSYKLHEHFGQPSRYFLFLREPIARTISLYNYQRFQHDFLQTMKNMDESHRRLQLFSKKWFLIDGKVPSFQMWLERSYNRDYPFYFTMTRFLQQFDYLETDLSEGAWDRLFAKFFFIGLTETMNEDELYLYHEMGTGCFWADRNRSYPYVSQATLDAKTIEKIREKNGDDFTLYERGRSVNLKWKQNQKNLPKIVKSIEWKKRRLFVREKVFPFLKFLLRPIRNRIRKCFVANSAHYERFEPHLKDLNTALEHYRRYTVATSFVEGKTVLDLACGEGYGVFMLGQRAERVIGIDCCLQTIAAAKKKYTKQNISYQVGSMLDFSLKEKELFDVIVCFEALEHIEDHETCFKEIKKHLKKRGLLILSTPNRPVYSQGGKNKNPFHLKELDRLELETLFARHFKYTKLYGQKTVHFSHIFPLDDTPNCFLDFAMRDLNPPYFFCLASDDPIDESLARFYDSDPRFSEYILSTSVRS